MALSTNLGVTYLHVAGFAGDTLATYAIDANGAPTQILGSPIALGSGFHPNSVTSVVVNGNTYIYVGTDFLADMMATS